MFTEATPIKQSPVDQDKTGKLDLSWLGGWSPLHVFSTPRNDKQRSLDDSFITVSALETLKGTASQSQSQSLSHSQVVWSRSLSSLGLGHCPSV